MHSQAAQQRRDYGSTVGTPRTLLGGHEPEPPAAQRASRVSDDRALHRREQERRRFEVITSRTCYIFGGEREPVKYNSTSSKLGKRSMRTFPPTMDVHAREPIIADETALSAVRYVSLLVVEVSLRKAKIYHVYRLLSWLKTNDTIPELYIPV